MFCLVQQDDALIHNALSMKQLLANKRILVLGSPLYSTDFDLKNLFLSPKGAKCIERNPISICEKVNNDNGKIDEKSDK